MNYRAFHKLSYGIYLICAQDGDESFGYVANTAFQVTSEPPKIAISCHKENQTLKAIEHSRAFSLSVLHEGTQMDLIQTFGYSSDDHSNKFKRVKVGKGKTGSPIVLTDTMAYFECRVVNAYDEGTHILFIGEVVDATLVDEKKDPMTYAYYREVKKAFSPPHSPTYVDKEKLAEGKTDAPVEYLCQICGYIYDPAEGDPRHGIPPGTPWEELPDDWVCPICRANKSYFKKMG